jgi:hypothetical protein
MEELGKFYERTIRQMPIDQVKRICVLVEMGAIRCKGGKAVISGKFAFEFYQRTGVPYEILKEWINDYIKDGR